MKRGGHMDGSVARSAPAVDQGPTELAVACRVFRKRVWRSFSAPATDRTGGCLPRVQKKGLEIVQCASITLRQLRSDLIARDQQILKRLPAIRVRHLVCEFTGAAEETRSGFGGQPVILLARLEIREADDIPQLRYGKLLSCLTQFGF